MKSMILLLCLLQGMPLGSPQTSISTCGSPVSGSEFWYKADAGVTCSGACSNGSSVTSWADQSGNSRTATTASGTLTFSTSQLNSLPAITSAGSAWATIGGSTIGASDKHSVFIVWNNTLAGGARGIMGGPSADNTITVYTNVGLGSFGFCYDTSVTTFGNCTSTGTTVSTWYQGNILQRGPASGSGSLIQFRVNESPISLAGGGNNLNVNPPELIFAYSASLHTFVGSIAEIIYYSTDLSGGDVTTNETYLHCRYGI